MSDGWKVKGAIAAVSASFWVASVFINNKLFAAAAMGPGVDVVFIPSGVRLIALMIGGMWAAIGIAVGSLVLVGPEFGYHDLPRIAVTAVATAIFPYAALLATLRLLGIRASLRNLATMHLPLIALGVAAGSSVLHNLFFVVMGIQPLRALPANTLAMATGDFTGTLLAMGLVLAFLRLTSRSER